jgi:hypothetical protein
MTVHPMLSLSSPVQSLSPNPNHVPVNRLHITISHVIPQRNGPAHTPLRAEVFAGLKRCSRRWVLHVPKADPSGVHAKSVLAELKGKVPSGNARCASVDNLYHCVSVLSLELRGSKEAVR